MSDTNEQIAYLRSSVIGLLIGECTKAFLDNEARILEGEFEGASSNILPNGLPQPTNIAAEVSFRKIYRSRDVLDIELAGFRIISTLLELMIDAVCSPEKAYSQLLINRVSGQYNMKATALYERIQAVLDYISGMTDVFALDLYRKTTETACLRYNYLLGKNILFAPEVRLHDSGSFSMNDWIWRIRFSARISSTAIKIPVSSTSPKP